MKERAFRDRPVVRYEGALRRGRALLSVCRSLVSVAPTKTDSTLRKVVKVAAALEIVRSHIEGEVSALDAFVATRRLRKHRSRQLVALFFDTPLLGSFETDRIRLDSDTTLLRASRGTAVLYFVLDPDRSDARADDEMYYEGDVDFAAILEGLWEHFKGRLNVRIQTAARGSSLAFSSFPLNEDDVFGSAAKRSEELVKKHALYKKDGIHRTYLFLGPPGGGKSTEATRFVGRIGKRILRMDAMSLSRFGAQEMEFLLGALGPDSLVVDDIDKGTVGNRWDNDETATILGVLEWVKLEHPEVMLVMTANREDLPETFVRPGRVDEPLFFDAPNKRDRRAILQGYIDKMVPKERHPTKVQLTTFVARTEGLSGAWLRELAIQLRYVSPTSLAKTITAMKKLHDETSTERRRRRGRKRRKARLVTKKNEDTKSDAAAAVVAARVDADDALPNTKEGASS